MTEKIKKQYFIIPAALFVLSILLCLTFWPTAKADEPTYETKTLTEIASPTIAGSSGPLPQIKHLFIQCPGIRFLISRNHTYQMY